MYFLGTAKVDSSNRITLVKDVTEILHIESKDYVEFFIDDGDILIRKVIPRSGMGFKNTNFWDWSERRDKEINMIELSSPEVAQKMRKQLNMDKEDIRQIEKQYCDTKNKRGQK